MMNGWFASPSAWEWAWMLLGPLVLSVLAGIAIVAGVRSLHRVGAPRALEPAPPPRAEEVLADRFARGEIAEDEYWQRLHALRAVKKD